MTSPLDLTYLFMNTYTCECIFWNLLHCPYAASEMQLRQIHLNLTDAVTAGLVNR